MGSEDRKHDATTPSLATNSRVRRIVRSRWTLAALSASLTATLALGYTFIARPAHAATLTVCASASCTYHSINDAIAAASAGDTITVQAGTYDSATEPTATKKDTQVVINKPINLVGAGAGSTIIRGLPADGASISGVIDIPTLSTPGNVTISGFTLEGAILNDSNDDGMLVVVQDANAGDTITVKNNVLADNATINPGMLGDQIDAMVVQTNAKVNVTNNTFSNVFRAALFEDDPNTINFTGNTLNLHAIYNGNTVSTGIGWWAEGMLFMSDNGVAMNGPYLVSGNTFGNYPGMAVGVDSGYPGGYIGHVSNLTISNNVMNEYGALASGSSFADTPDISMHAFASSPLTNVSIKYNTFNMSSSVGHGYAIVTNGLLGSGISIDHNLIKGSGSSAPLGGIKIISPDAATAISVTNNRITGFVTGIQSDALPTGASITATQNCIMGNTTGATVAAGANLNATNDWWGTATGPKPSGSGNAATGSVTTSPHLTAPAAICAGPVASGVKANPNPSHPNTDVLLSGQLSDSSTGGFAIASAQFSIDGDVYKTMYSSDGVFNAVAETAFVHIWQLTPGTHTFCVRGTDSAGNVGAATCISQTVTALAASATATSTATAAATSTPATTATDTPTTSPAPTDTPTPTTSTNPVGGNANGGSSSFPTIPVLIGALVALLLIGGGILFWALSRRRREQQ